MSDTLPGAVVGEGPVLLVYSRPNWNFGELQVQPTRENVNFPSPFCDLMEVVRRLGLRYLWFDAACLVQDDLEDLHPSILSMDLIMEGAC